MTSDHALVCHRFRCLSHGTGVIEPRYQAYIAVPKTMFILIFFFNLKKKANQNTSHPQKDPKPNYPTQIHVHASETLLFQKTAQVLSVITKNWILIIFHILLHRLKQAISSSSSLKVVLVRLCSKCLSLAPLSNLLCLLVQGHFFWLSAILIKLGNIKIKLMDLTLVFMAEKGIAESLFFFLLDWLGWGKKPSSRQEYQIILLQFYTLEVHNMLKTSDFHISKEKTNPVFHGIAGCFLWNNLLEAKNKWDMETPSWFSLSLSSPRAPLTSALFCTSVRGWRGNQEQACANLGMSLVGHWGMANPAMQDEANKKWANKDRLKGEQCPILNRHLKWVGENTHITEQLLLDYKCSVLWEQQRAPLQYNIPTSPPVVVREVELKPEQEGIWLLSMLRFQGTEG